MLPACQFRKQVYCSDLCSLFSGKSSFGERAIAAALSETWPEFSKAIDILNEPGRSRVNALDLDIYSPLLSVGVEFHGADHFKAKRGGELGLRRRQACDRRRRRLCKERGIHLIEIHHKDYDKDPEGTIKKLIEEIRTLSKKRTPNLLETAA